MVTFTNQQGYSRNDGPTQYAGLKPSQPLPGNIAVTTGAEATFFQYDLITAYGLRSSVSNSAQTTRVMVGWNLTVLIGILCSTDMVVKIYVNSGINSTFTQIDSSPLATIVGGAKWQFVTVGPLAAAHIRGTLQASASNSTVEYHVRLIEP
jgi:hypothetical protein